MQLHRPYDSRFSRRRLLGGLAGAAVASGTLGSFGGVDLGSATEAAVAASLKSQRKQMLVVFHAGGLSQLESWDPKPSTDTGGPCAAIDTSVPGLKFAEWLPHTAKQAHHLTVLRGLSTGENDHGPGAYLMMTGRRIQSGFLYPTLPCWANQALTPPGLEVPGYINVGDAQREAAFLGVRFDPVKVKVGKPIENVDRPKDLPETAIARRMLLRQRADSRFQSRRGTADTAAYALSFDQAEQLVRNKKLFDLTREPACDHERYGKHEMGQQCLLARRLLEHGVTCVKVIHPGYDTHAENFNVHLDLLEQFDRPFACLIEDLAARGLLDHTLVAAIGEFGRTPNINTRMGRDHWSGAWSAAFAGVGMPAGKVVGKTNSGGTEVTDVKVTAPDLFHTLLTAVEVDPHAEVGVEGQKIPIADPAGHVIKELLKA